MAGASPTKELLRQLLKISSLVISLVGVVVLAISLPVWIYLALSDDFNSSLVREAWKLSRQINIFVLSSFGIIAFAISLALKLYRGGWPTMKEHLVKHLLESLIPAAVALALLFTYNLFYVVPARINRDASTLPPFPHLPAPSLDGPKDNRSRPSPCIVIANETSHITARLYVFGEAASTPGSSNNVVFNFQELFYDWTTHLSANTDLEGVMVVIRDSHPLMDRVRITPDAVGDVSGQLPHWMSGFEEPRDPDFYTRNISFHRVTKSGVDISFRRPFVFVRGQNSGSQRDFVDRTLSITRLNCKTFVNGYNDLDQSAKLLHQFTVLASWKYAGPDHPSKMSRS